MSYNKSIDQQGNLLFIFPFIIALDVLRNSVSHSDIKISKKKNLLFSTPRKVNNHLVLRHFPYPSFNVGIGFHKHFVVVGGFQGLPSMMG